jgi:hypothetical protein
VSGIFGRILLTFLSAVDEFNHPMKLSLEATMINQNFSQQILKEPVEPELRKTVRSCFVID